MCIYLDTETTGTGPDDRLCQIAFKPDNSPAVCDLFNPGILIARMPYGKHKGMLFSEVPQDYLEWLLGTELDEDMAFTVKTNLGHVTS